jgi:2,3-bisphosphoglycerate-independent phosphoglycerate mutase
MTEHPAAAAAVIPVVLLILDGVGCRDDAPDNAISSAAKPHWDRLWSSFAHTTIDASELAVGLPRGQIERKSGG